MAPFARIRAQWTRLERYARRELDDARLEIQIVRAKAEAQWAVLGRAALYGYFALACLYLTIMIVGQLDMVLAGFVNYTILLIRLLIRLLVVLWRFKHSGAVLLVSISASLFACVKRWGFWGCLKGCWVGFRGFWRNCWTGFRGFWRNCWNGFRGFWRNVFYTWFYITVAITFPMLIKHDIFMIAIMNEVVFAYSIGLVQWGRRTVYNAITMTLAMHFLWGCVVRGTKETLKYIFQDFIPELQEEFLRNMGDHRAPEFRVDFNNALGIGPM